MKINRRSINYFKFLARTMNGMAEKERHLFIDCEYDKKHVTSEVDAAIKRIFAEAATRLAAKVALLARPENVKIKADYFEDNRYRSLFDVDANANANDDPA